MIARSALVALFIAVAAPAGAHACTLTAPPPGSPQADPLHGDVIAVYGEVLSRTQVDPQASGQNVLMRYRFRVLETYKGKPPKVMTLLGRTDEALCGAGLLGVGEHFGILVTGRSPWKIDATNFVSRAELRQAKRRHRRARHR